MIRPDVASVGMGLPPALHAPDGFFSLPVVLAGWAVSLVVIGYAVRQTNRQLNERMVPLMGIFAAFIFAAQMLNFPVAGGTSGHLVGGGLAAIMLGPWAAVLVMTAVVATQALIFQDGGLVALGINLLNMAVVSSLVGWLLYRGSAPLGASGGPLMLRAFVVAWVSVMASAAAVTLQLAASGTTPLMVALPAMLGVHALIGVGEGLITVGAVAFISASRKDLLDVAVTAPQRG